MKKDITEDLLIRYVLGEASHDEIQEVAYWINLSESNARQLEQTRFILETSQKLAEKSQVSELDAWEKFKTNRDTLDGARTVRPIVTLNRWLQIAAALLILAGGWGGYNLLNRNAGNSGMMSYSTLNKVRTDTLPDGSVVHLNKNSRITFATNFKTHREIRLTGEAFFEVTHNSSAPFTVQVKDVNIRDIGTAFNVNSNQDHVEIIVESGLVKVTRLSNAIELKASELVRIKPGDKQLKIERTNDVLYQYYRSNQFVATNTPLWRMIQMLNEAYDTNIRIEGKELSHTPITGIFKNNSLDTILNVIKLTTPEIHIKKTAQGIVLKKAE